MYSKEISKEELENFFKVMDKYNLPYNKTPRTQEEINNLKCVYNLKDRTIYAVCKDKTLSKDEMIITPKDLFDIIANKKIFIREEDVDITK